MNKELAIECIKTQRQFVDNMTREAFDMAIDLIKENVVPVRHGRWECGEENSWWCSVCDMGFDLLYGTPQENLYNYCPNCGAKMDQEVD